MHNRVLVVEDDLEIVELLKLYLESNSFEVVVAKNGIEALDLLNSSSKIDIMLVDIMMPKMNGYELIKEIRKEKNIPIIIISAKNLDTDKILGLNIGADVYITKPFNPLEVIAYINAFLRRYYNFDNKNNNPIKKVLKVGELTLEMEKYILKKNNIVIPLTSTEFKIVLKMMQNPGKVFTKAQLYECINGELYENDDNTMMVHISNIRAKIEDNPAQPIYIKTVRGLGYKLENKQD